MFVRANNSYLLPAAPNRVYQRPRRVVRVGFRGLGQTSGSTIAKSVGGGLLAAAPLTGPAAPFVAAAGAITELVASLFSPNLNKIQATSDVNQIEPTLKENLSNWLSLSSSQKTQSVQAAAIQVAQAGIAQMQQLCGQVKGSAGTNCISQRVPGGCGFHVAQPYGWIGPNQSFVPSGSNDPKGSVCWDWGYYVNSIAQDPNVIPDNSSASQALGSQLIAGGSTFTTGATSTPGSSVIGTSLTAAGPLGLPLWMWLVGGGVALWAVAR